VQAAQVMMGRVAGLLVLEDGEEISGGIVRDYRVIYPNWAQN
jgi:hypothetical protein